MLKTRPWLHADPPMTTAGLHLAPRHRCTSCGLEHSSAWSASRTRRTPSSRRTAAAAAPATSRGTASARTAGSSSSTTAAGSSAAARDRRRWLARSAAAASTCRTSGARPMCCPRCGCSLPRTRRRRPWGRCRSRPWWRRRSSSLSGRAAPGAARGVAGETSRTTPSARRRSGELAPAHAQRGASQEVGLLRSAGTITHGVFRREVSGVRGLVRRRGFGPASPLGSQIRCMRASTAALKRQILIERQPFHSCSWSRSASSAVRP
mmetsp:Transcript_98086/g.274569  ORF Transcript_98086/g.274569 Transcript_98086/m.274569 type:complete len:264 (+) Transcript_98086:383-1174(+)